MKGRMWFFRICNKSNIFKYGIQQQQLRLLKATLWFVYVLLNTSASTSESRSTAQVKHDIY